MADRYVLLGVAPARSDWFRRVATWAANAALPAEFVRCVSLEEAIARLSGERPFSALLVDAAIPGLDRDVLAAAVARGCAPIVVGAEDQEARWRDLGAMAALPREMDQPQLLQALADVADRVPRAQVELPVPVDEIPRSQGRLFAVTGPGGTGASIVAIALAQGLAGRQAVLPGSVGDDASARRPSVLLADLCRVADQALYHEAHELVPGVQELVELHRTSRPGRAEVLAQTFDVPARGYRLMLGLRRPRHWVGLRQRALEAGLDSLQWVADVVVADVDPEVEGETETGSLDVQERNLLARSTLSRADLVLVVGQVSMKGAAALVRTVGELVDHGVEPERLIPVANRSPRSPRRRAEMTTTVARLLTSATGVPAERFAPVLHLPDHDPEPALRDGVALAPPLPRSVSRGVAGLLTQVTTHDHRADPAPIRIAPGSLSTFTAGEPPR